MTHVLINGELRLTLSTTIYSMDVLHKCFYWLLDDFTIGIDDKCTGTAVVSIRPKGNPLVESDVVTLLQRIQDDLIDFRVREAVTNETRSIRELLIAKAFAHWEDPEQVTSKHPRA